MSKLDYEHARIDEDEHDYIASVFPQWVCAAPGCQRVVEYAPKWSEADAEPGHTPYCASCVRDDVQFAEDDEFNIVEALYLPHIPDSQWSLVSGSGAAAYAAHVRAGTLARGSDGR